MSKKVFVFVSLLCSIVSVYAQKSGAYEFSRFNSQRTVSLKGGKEITVQFLPTLEAGATDTVAKSVVGILSSTDATKLNMLVTTEYARYAYSPDSVLETYRKYSYDYPMTYSADAIAYISYAPKARPAIEMATFASLISLGIIAPLYALNIKEGNFNSDAYMAIATPAAVATIITLPLYFKIEERKVQFVKK